MTATGIALIAAAAVVVIAVLGFAFYAFSIAFYAPKRKRDRDLHRLPEVLVGNPYTKRMFGLIDSLAAVPCERFYIKSRGKKLWARYYEVKKGAPLQIQFNGYRGLPLRDFSGGCRLALEEGQNILLVDQRAHGDSDGSVITFGIREKYDVLKWVEYAIGRFGKDVDIILSGVSMGAATVLEASALDLPQNVRGIIADSPYSSPAGIIAKTCEMRGFPVRLTMPFIRMGAFIFGGFILKGGAKEAVKRSRVPILLIHGESDSFVPPEMSAEIEKNCASPCHRYTFAGAEHGISYIVDPERYRQIVVGFCESILTGKN